MKKQEQLYKPIEDNQGIPPQGDYIKHTSSEVKPSYVTFEQSKWLKEKGFNVDTETCFHALLGNVIDTFIKWDNDRGYLVRPEHWQLTEWLRVNHNIIILPDLTKIDKFGYRIIWESKTKGLQERLSHTYNFNSPQEAFSAAFDYIKDNNYLI